jgi:anaerobic glycerol-3-phosphate dehydrogenase
VKAVVIGGGAAGTAAALALRRGNADVVVLDGAAGATDTCSGAWDVATVSSESPLARASLADRIAAIAKRNDVHPYARIASPVETIARVHDAFLSAIGGYSAIDVGSLGVRVATDRGVIRRVASVESRVLDLNRAPGGLVAVASFVGYQGADGGFLARSLSADPEAVSLSLVEVSVEFLSRRSDALMWPHEAASLGDAADACARLVALLRRALPGGAPHAWLLPPVLGLEAREVARDLESALGHPVGEVAQGGAGPQGIRLRRRLAKARAAAGVVDLRARASRIAPGCVTASSGAVIETDAIILATGSVLAGGLVPTNDGFEEPLTGTSVGHGDFGTFDAPGDAFTRGVVVDARFRVVDGAEKREGLFACGSLLAGTSHGDGTGLGVSATTGWLAGESALVG